MSDPHTLDRLVSRLALMSSEMEPKAVAAAQAEATHKAERSKAFLLARTEGGTVADAEAKAEVAVADLYMDRLTKAAVADSNKEVLRSLRAAIDAEQTNRADVRAADIAMARGHGGAA